MRRREVIPRVDVMVVSHSCVRRVNQLVHNELALRGRKVVLVLPDRWRDEYQRGVFRTTVVDRLAPDSRRLPVLLAGSPQRHFYLVNAVALLRSTRPRHVLIEEEPYSIAAMQWGVAAAAPPHPLLPSCMREPRSSSPASRSVVE